MRKTQKQYEVRQHWLYSLTCCSADWQRSAKNTNNYKKLIHPSLRSSKLQRQLAVCTLYTTHCTLPGTTQHHRRVTKKLDFTHKKLLLLFFPILRRMGRNKKLNGAPTLPRTCQINTYCRVPIKHDVFILPCGKIIPTSFPLPSELRFVKSFNLSLF